jgi:hypothetical protein
LREKKPHGGSEIQPHAGGNGLRVTTEMGVELDLKIRHFTPHYNVKILSI